MTTPEPLDETVALPPPETRGGDQLADITVPAFNPPFAGESVGPCDPDVCDCGSSDCAPE